MKLINILCVLAVCTGCGNGSVGTDPCPLDPISCSSQALRAPPPPPPPRFVANVNLNEAQPLTPTWIRSVPVAKPEPVPGNELPFVQLLTDSQRTVYLASVSEDNALRVSRLDDDGSIVESSAAIAPPAGVSSDSGPPGIVKSMYSPKQTDPDMGFKVIWTPKCYLTLDPCDAKKEKLIFTSDLSKAPERFEIDPVITIGMPDPRVDNVLRDERGDYVTLTSSQETDTPPVVSKLNGTTRQVEWTQDDLLYGDDYRWVNAVTLKDGRVALLLSNATFAQHVAVELDEAGEPTNFELHKVQSLSIGVALLAALGEPVLVQLNKGTHLDVWRVGNADRASEAVAFNQAGRYVDLQLLWSAADPDGNVYIATRTGGAEGVRPALCRATRADGKCVTLPFYVDPAGTEELVFDEIIARAGGVIFLRSGTYLLRVDFPD